MNENFDKSLERPPRVLSPFFVQELLLEHMEGRLSKARQKQVEDRIASNRDLKRLSSGMRVAKAYAEALAGIEPSHHLVASVASRRSWRDALREHFAIQRWPEVWRWTLESALLAGLIGLVISQVPVEKLTAWMAYDGRTLTLADAEVSVPPSSLESTVATTTAAPAEAQEGPKEAVVVGEQAPEPTASSTVQVSPEKKAIPLAPQGHVYRAQMDVSDFEGASEAIRLLIESLEGIKAGQVDLGHRTNEQTSYFHFAMPEDHYDTLVEGLKPFGRVRIYKDNHPRVMPKGSIRIILEVKNRPEQEP